MALLRSTVGTTLFGYSVETIQSVRGLDPRFTLAGGAVDQLVGVLLGIDAIFIIVLFVIFGARLFRRDVAAARPLVVLGSRYVPGGRIADWGPGRRAISRGGCLYAQAILGFGVRGGREAGRKVVESTKIFSHLANIGDAKSLIIHPATTTHSQLTEEEQATTGVTPDYVRLSVGLETVGDLIADLEQALLPGLGIGTVIAGKDDG